MIDYNILLKVNLKVSPLKLALLTLIFISSIFFKYIGMNILGFILILVFAILSYRIYLKQKSIVRFIMIKENRSSHYLTFFNSSKVEILSDNIENYIFHEPIGKVFEVKHLKTNNNFRLGINKDTSNLLEYLKSNNIQLHKNNIKKNFWYILDAILTSL